MLVIMDEDNMTQSVPELSLLGGASKEIPQPEKLNSAINRALDQGWSHEDIAKNTFFQSAAQTLLLEFEKEQAMFSPSTQKRLRLAWGIYVCWCEQTNKHALPSSPNQIREYLQFRSETRHRNTLSVDVWAISTTLKAAGCPDTTNDLRVKNALRAIVKRKVRVEDEHVRQATPFRDKHLDQLNMIYGNSCSPNELRDLAVLNVAYESMLRVSELVRIKLSHLVIKSDGSAALCIPFTKTNQSGDGQDWAYLSETCVLIVKRYLLIAGIDSQDGGYLFRPIHRCGYVRQSPVESVTGTRQHTPMTTRSMDRIFLKAWLDLTPAVNRNHPISSIKSEHRPFTAHSARVGAAQDLLEQGFDSLQVRQAGRWQSDTMVLRYGQHIMIEGSAMAKSRKSKKLRNP
ncbi:tyrosine-type recombinase/integrase [Vibrio metoecus]|nr:hypothetical protein [Vibrio cholerae]